MFVGHTIWHKRDMIGYLLDSIVERFPHDRLHVGYSFDDSPEDAEVFHAIAPHFLIQKTIPYSVCDHRGQPEIREVGAHNALLREFLNTDCQFAVIFQDDQRLRTSMMPGLEALHAKPNVGVVGGRDGYAAGFVNMISSRWSESTGSVRRLEPNEIAECGFINTGPIVYSRRAVESVGLLDEGFTGFYSLDDYAARCTKAGLQNYVIGVDLDHKRFGRLMATWWAVNGDPAAQDLARLKSKHGDLWP